MDHCFEALTRDAVPEEPLSALLVAELPAAVKNGVAAALLVTAVLLWRGGFDPALVAGLSLAAVPLAVAIHLPVLVVGVLVRRAIERRKGPAKRPA